MIVTLDNFDWSVTNRDLVIFMPNWARGEYVRKTVELIQTEIPKDKWIVLTINDRIHEDLSDLEPYNAVYLTFGPDRPKDGRGDAFMRNIAIKRCKSKWFFQKDPEVIVRGDFIKHILECPTEMYRLSGPALKVRRHTTERFLKSEATLEDCYVDADQYPINPAMFMFFHFGFAVKTYILQGIRGYDEDYKKMYCADTDLYGRLMAMGVKPTFDPECHPVHLWHVEPWAPNTPKTKADYAEMRNMLASKNPRSSVRNDPLTWGEGD